MSYRRQEVLLPELRKRLEHGGSLGKGRRKLARPITTRRPLHVVLRSEEAVGELALTRKRNADFIRSKMKELSKRMHIKVYELAVNGNHIHALVRPRTREGFQNFLRAFAGQVSQFVTGARKGRANKIKFWQNLTYSRIVEWGKSFLIARGYVLQNQLEALGIIPFKPRAPRGKIPSFSQNARKSPN
jgi:REP element-mobilizing transposase RayT